MLSLRRKDIVCQQAVELVTDYLEGTLSRRDRRRFEAHLRACPNCTAYLEQIRITIELTGSIEPEDLTPEARRTSPSFTGAGDPSRAIPPDRSCQLFRVPPSTGEEQGAGMTQLSRQQEELCEQSQWDFSDLRALYINGTRSVHRSYPTHKDWPTVRSR